MLASTSRSPSPDSDTDIFTSSLVPERENKPAGTTTITFDSLLPHERPLLLHEDLQEGCGGQLWPAGMLLSRYMLQYHKSLLKGKSIVEIGAGGGLVGLAVALGCQLDKGQKIYLTDQIPMKALMQKNISLNRLEQEVEALVYDWGTSPPSALPVPPDVLLAADCVYFEPAFPLLLETLQDLIGPDTTCYFCFKKRRKADMRFIKDMHKTFAVKFVEYDGRETDQRDGVFLYEVKKKMRDFKPTN
jgi:predicted nicotinamide N-methyase